MGFVEIPGRVDTFDSLFDGYNNTNTIPSPLQGSVEKEQDFLGDIQYIEALLWIPTVVF